MSPSHSAARSALGYYYQGIFALVVILDESSDDAGISVETADDVVLTIPGRKTLIQLKHKKENPPPLTIKGRDLWKTLAIWAEHIQSNDAAETVFILVTVAPISDESPLTLLRTAGSDRQRLVEALADEANRVKVARESAPEGTLPPHEDRAEGCAAFLDLTPAQRIALVEAIHLCPESFNAADALVEVSNRLRTVPPSVRNRITVRLIEWWDRQVVSSLTGERLEVITKSEVQQQILRLANEFAEDSLPDEFGSATPEDWKAHLSSTVEQQIHLVRGSSYHYERAARDLWRARNQRDQWLKANLSSISEIGTHEEHLVEEWKDHHDAICDLTVDDECCEAGRRLLEWTHSTAWRETKPIRAKWTHPFLVRGTYQILADKLRVGWHPRFRDLMKEANDSNES